MPFEPLPLTAETLIALLNEGTERDGLDFKRSCDLSDTGEAIELAKDLGAMQIHGGYIVVGADNNGQPSGEVRADHAKHFDQATLHAKMARYLADGFDVRSTDVVINENVFGLICALPHPDGWAPFKITGKYLDHKAREKVVFRAGDVFTRRGSRSEPWTAEDVRHIRAEIRRQEREAARRELADLFKTAQDVSRLATAPTVALSWEMDPEDIATVIVEQLRVADDIPIIQLLKGAPAAAYALLAGPTADIDDCRRLLDGITAVAGRLASIERTQLAARAVAALTQIYNGSFRQAGLSRRTDLCVSAEQLGLDLLSRAQALGALAVRERQWGLARTIALEPVADHAPDYWGTWILHAEVMAARANLLRLDAEHPAGRNPLVLAQEHALRLHSLRRDVLDDDALVTSLCQFDMLAAFSIVGAGVGRSRDGSFLAYLASWHARRTDPIVVELIRGGALRDTVFPHDDASLADTIRIVDANASHMTNAFAGWHGHEDPQILEFIEKHPATPNA